MGGIFGFIGLGGQQQRELLGKMGAAMLHRGNNTEFLLSPPFFFGLVSHSWEIDTRIVASPDKSIVAVCEGEIYNSKELTNEVEIEPEHGERESGFDLIPALYLNHGENFARYINGIFAIALYDARKDTLILVRDHLGSHSLFYARYKDNLVFASTISSLLATGLISRAIDTCSLDKYLGSLAISPPHTMFKHVMAVRPAHALIARNGHIKEYEYWALGKIKEDYSKSETDFAEEIKHIFEDAVTRRAEHSGSIGTLVSGGVDTSAIAAMLSMKAGGRQVKGFSVAFHEKEFSDASLQDVIYSKFDLEAHRLLLVPDKFTTVLTNAIQYLDSPVNDVAFAGMLHAFQCAASTGCTAVFEGEGSDELFCTGHSFGELSIQRFLILPHTVRGALFGMFKSLFGEGSDLISKGTRFLARLGMTDLERRCTWVPVFPWSTRRKLLRASYDSTETWAAAKQYYDRTQLNDKINVYQYGLCKTFLPDDLLFKNERMASAAGVINRTPFIDFRLVEKAFEVPARYKIQPPDDYSDGTKLIFKKAMRGIVPDEILDRKKTRGFSQPTALWFRAELKDFVYDHLLGRNARIFDWLDRSTVHRICHDFMTGKSLSDYFLNSLLILELWMQKHLR